MKINYYEVLGVQRSATDAEIRDRFRQLARASHPDRFSGAAKVDAEKKFQTLTEAMNVLTNEARRRQHDAETQGNVPKAATDFTQIAKAYIARGVKSYKDGDYRGAYEAFDMGAKHNPQDAKAFHYLSLAASRLPAMVRQAVQAVETAVQKDPFNPVYLKDAGLLCKRAGLPSKAERYLEEAVKWGQTTPDVEAALLELRQGKEPKEQGKGILDSLFRKG